MVFQEEPFPQAYNIVKNSKARQLLYMHLALSVSDVNLHWPLLDQVLPKISMDEQFKDYHDLWNDLQHKLYNLLSQLCTLYSWSDSGIYKFRQLEEGHARVSLHYAHGNRLN